LLLKDQNLTSTNGPLQNSTSPNKKIDNGNYRPPVTRALPPYREPPPPSVSPARISPTTVGSDRLKQTIFKVVHYVINFCILLYFYIFFIGVSE